MTSSIPAAFEKIVARNPQAVAVRTPQGAMTYDQINRTANRLARLIASHGLPPESRVAIEISRGPLQVIAMLAILKSGTAYVPLDPSYPLEHTRYIIQDSNCRLLLVDHGRLPELGIQGLTRIQLDDLEISRLPHDDGNLAPVDERALAYVMYTSGTTGRPKGVLIEHRGVVLVNFAMAEFYRQCGATRMYRFSSLTFDASVAETFVSLFSGIELFVDPVGPAALGPDELLDTLAREEVDCLITTPSYLARATPRFRRYPRLVSLGGEYCPPALARLWSKHHVLINGYGPTEITCVATMGLIDGSDATTDIGLPLPHIRMHVLNSDRMPVQPGDVGELYVAGPSLARGYLGRDDLTAAAFVSGGGEGRMYRTGDFGRVRADGHFECLGRVDDQVKIQGVRVEPAEIESCLHELPAVSAAVVVAAGEAAAKLLVGFVQLCRQMTVEEIRTALRRRFPAQLVPRYFEIVHDLPLLPSGKVDRRRMAMRAEQILRETRTDEGPAPQQQNLGEVIAAAWCRALQRSSAQDDDNFFALGGESLRAAEVIAATRQYLKTRVPLRTIFDHPTFGEYRTAVEGLQLALRSREKPNSGKLKPSPDCPDGCVGPNGP
jgi:amino acid adenylation domain-containing protein